MAFMLGGFTPFSLTGRLFYFSFNGFRISTLGDVLQWGFRFSFTVGDLFWAVIVAPWAHTSLGPSFLKENVCAAVLVFFLLHQFLAFRL
jgi:hypothetical protein